MTRRGGAGREPISVVNVANGDFSRATELCGVGKCRKIGRAGGFARPIESIRPSLVRIGKRAESGELEATL